MRLLALGGNWIVKGLTVCTGNGLLVRTSRARRGRILIGSGLLVLHLAVELLLIRRSVRTKLEETFVLECLLIQRTWLAYPPLHFLKKELIDHLDARLDLFL